MVLCHVSWAPLTFTWKSGWTFWSSECCCVLQNMNIKMLLCSSSECWCSSRNSSGFIIYEYMMSFWVYPMRALWFSGHYSCYSKFIRKLLDKVIPNFLGIIHVIPNSLWWVSGFTQCVPYDFAQTSESCWIKLFQICIGLCAGERIVVRQFASEICLMILCLY